MNPPPPPVDAWVKREPGREPMGFVRKSGFCRRGPMVEPAYSPTLVTKLSAAVGRRVAAGGGAVLRCRKFVVAKNFPQRDSG